MYLSQHLLSMLLSEFSNPVGFMYSPFSYLRIVDKKFSNIK